MARNAWRFRGSVRARYGRIGQRRSLIRITTSPTTAGVLTSVATERSKALAGETFGPEVVTRLTTRKPASTASWTPISTSTQRIVQPIVAQGPQGFGSERGTVGGF